MKIALRTKIFYVLVCASLMVALALGAQPLNSAKAAGPEACSATTIGITGITDLDSAFNIYGDTVQFQAQVPTAGLITGYVQFYADPDGAGGAASLPIGSPVPLDGAKNTSMTTSELDVLWVGTPPVNTPWQITATYLGDANYCPSTSPWGPTYQVTPKNVTVTGLVVNPTKVYDGNNIATFTGGTFAVGTTAGKVLPGDVVTLVQGGTYPSKNVGTNLVVTAATSFTGPDGGNYVGVWGGGTFLADITPKPLHVTGITADGKVYDGSMAVPAAKLHTTGASFVIGEILAGDTVVLSGAPITGEYDLAGTLCAGLFTGDKNVGAKTVCVYGYTLTGGADANNYTLVTPTTTATITPATITLAPVDKGLVPQNKPYDGNANVLTWNIALPTLGAGDGVKTDDFATVDNVTLANPTAGFGATFASSEVGTWTVTATGFVLGGTDAGNYVLAAQPHKTGVADLGTAKITQYAIVIGDLKLDNNGFSYRYNGLPHFADLSATNPVSGLPMPGTFNGVMYQDPITGLWSGDAPITVGTYNVRISGFTPDNTTDYKAYTPATPTVMGSFTIFKDTPIPYIANNNAPYTGSPIAADVKAKSWFDIDVPGTVSGIRYNGSVTVPSAVGSYYVTGTFTPNDVVNFASPVAIGDYFYIVEATPTLSVTNSPVIYTGAAQAAIVSSGSVAGVVSDIKYNGSAIAPTNVGTYAVTADFVPTDPDYNTLLDAPAGNFVINKATPTATLAVNNSPVPYDGAPHAATVGITVSSVPGSVSGILTGGAAFQTAAGTYAVTANFIPTDTANYVSLMGLDAGSFVISSLSVELIHNGGFNIYSGTSMIPDSWSALKFAATDGRSRIRVEGMYSVLMQGQYQRKALYQEILVSGAAGTPLTFKFAVKGEDVPAAGICVGQVKLYNGSTLVQVRNMLCGTGTYNWTTKTVSFNAYGDYTKVVVLFANFKDGGKIWFDAASLLKH